MGELTSRKNSALQKKLIAITRTRKSIAESLLETLKKINTSDGSVSEKKFVIYG